MSFNNYSHVTGHPYVTLASIITCHIAKSGNCTAILKQRGGGGGWRSLICIALQITLMLNLTNVH